jgi:hypothetical protein
MAKELRCLLIHGKNDTKINLFSETWWYSLKEDNVDFLKHVWLLRVS